MTPDRETMAQQPPDPDGDYRRFPARTIRAGSGWFRQHRRDLGPWWFSTSQQGRFDLPPPDGTCYLASSPQAATRERVGPDLAAAGQVPVSVLHGRVVSTLSLPEPVRAANLESDRAADQYGITGELATMIPYRVPQTWAATVHTAGFGGLVARLRFTPSRQLGLALFGTAGDRPDWAVDPQPQPLADVANQMGIHVVDPPDDDQITIVDM